MNAIQTPDINDIREELVAVCEGKNNYDKSKPLLCNSCDIRNSCRMSGYTPRHMSDTMLVKVYEDITNRRTQR